MKKVRTRHGLFILIVLHLTFWLPSQNDFVKVYSATYDQESREVLATPDGGYLIAGSANNSTLNDCDVYVMKTDAHGDFVWGKTYGGSRPDYAYGMMETADGNYFIVGFSQSFSGGDMDVYLIKIDPSGNMIWQKTYIGWGNEEGREIIKTLDGNYVIVGSTNSNLSSQDAFLMKLDPDGAVIWISYYGGSDTEFGNSVKQTGDGGFILTGQTFSYGQGGDTYLVKTNQMGDTLWTKHFGAALAEEGISVVSNDDGSIAVAVRDSSNGKDVDVRIVKTDASGNILWNKLYSGTQKDTPKRIRATTDGGYIVGAISRSFGWIYPDMWLLKLNAQGDSLWSRHFGGPNHEHCHDIKQCADGGYIAVGHSRSYAPAQQIMFVKVDNQGTVLVAENQPFAEGLNIYPNPSKDGILHLKINGGLTGRLRVTNTLGQLVYTDWISQSAQCNQILLTPAEPGVYFLTLENQSSIVTRKIIIEK